VRARRYETSRPVVVGIDGSDGAAEALRIAIREARLRGTRVRAVHVFHVPEGVSLAGFAPAEEDRQGYEDAARSVLADSVAGVGSDAEDVPVEQVLLENPAPAEALVAEAEAVEADLLVVGSRGLGGFREFLLGSVSHACCKHARCPVLVVPPVELESRHPDELSPAQRAGNDAAA